MSWYCITVAPQKEFIAQRVLVQMGVEAFVPTETKHIHRASKKDTIKVYPLLGSRYVFVRSRNELPPAELLQVHLFSGFVRGLDGPAIFSDNIILELERITKSQDTIPISDAIRHRSFRVGDAPLLVRGAYKGHSARVVDVSNGRALVLVSILGGAHAVRVRLDWLSHE